MTSVLPVPRISQSDSKFRKKERQIKTYIKQLMRTDLSLINPHARIVDCIFAVQLDIESNAIAFSRYYHAGSIVRVNDTSATDIWEIGIGREIDNSPDVICLFAFHRDIECFPNP